MKDFNAQLATVSETLADFKGGRSETSVMPLDGGGLASRRTGGYSINVHEPDYPYETVACGDIPEG